MSISLLFLLAGSIATSILSLVRQADFVPAKSKFDSSLKITVEELPIQIGPVLLNLLKLFFGWFIRFQNTVASEVVCFFYKNIFQQYAF